MRIRIGRILKNYDQNSNGEMMKAVPSGSCRKPPRNLNRRRLIGLRLFFGGILDNDDEFVRATAAELLADLPVSKANTDALKTAFSFSLVKDKVYNDAQLGILDALVKLDKKESVGTLLDA